MWRWEGVEERREEVEERGLEDVEVGRWGGGESGGWREWESANIDLNERVGGGACVGGRRGRMREGEV